ncbi:YgfZ/GcvT domain-containing protein [Roseibium algae]|uniref:Folate-binding protein n=1 Tax=Roseibium algae TaxID=3123038 RepID=A0ABU8TH46_9HYPH
MSHLHYAILKNRSLIAIGGEEATHFLQNLVTCDLDQVQETGAGFGALLTPQGKILFDFLIAKTEDGYLLDTPRETLAEFSKRLTFYRLRAKVVIEALDDTMGVIASWHSTDTTISPAFSSLGVTISDPRLADLGNRHLGVIADMSKAMVLAGASEETPDVYARHRISLAVPESLSDYAYSDIFPHDADMDQLNGVSFSKGCYVGQEVVSRMQHRATARKRMILISSDALLPEAGATITADGKPVGTLGSSTQNGDRHLGIALVRLDKAKAAHDKGVSFICDNIDVKLDLPEWAKFTWPSDPADV